MDILDIAIQYTRRGWRVIPVPFRSKNPNVPKWQKKRLTEAELPVYFNGKPQNIGVLLGEPSGWLIDVDLDHPLAVELAPRFLPPTPAQFGRPGKPRSHWIFHAASPIATKKFKSKLAGMIVEIRSTGAQTIFPPSTHESGELIQWQLDGAEPATVEPEFLRKCVEQLAHQVLFELGERKRAPKTSKCAASPSDERRSNDSVPADRVERCIAAMRRISIVDHRDGSHRLFVCACRAVEHDLTDAEAVSAIQAYAREKPFIRHWTDQEIIKRLRDAEKQCRRKQAFDVDPDGGISLGRREPKTGKLVLSLKRTLPTAEAYVRDYCLHPDGRTLYCHADSFVTWHHNRFEEIEESAVRKNLFPWLHDAYRCAVSPKGERSFIPFEANPASVNAALESIKAHTHLDVTITSPAWLRDSDKFPPPNEILPCRSSLLHLPTMHRLPSTPLLFTVSSLDFDPDPNAPEPKEWHSFLQQLFGDDSSSIELLQEWFGYCLTGDTSQQKMMLIVGPRRSGKGTIARVLTRVVGTRNVCGPTTSGLAGTFGLQPLICKSLAIVSDARFHGENISIVVERLLCISGEDQVLVERKFKTAVNMKLPTRFMFLTNELPRLADASGALAGRFIMLRLAESFYGKEDTLLANRLLGELPGILNWAIEGWHRLRERGHFVLPPSVNDLMQELEDLSSPVKAFVREMCIVGPGHRISLDLLYESWRTWCNSEGRQIVTTKQTFGRDLSAAVAGIKRRRGTGQEPFYEGISLREAAWE